MRDASVATPSPDRSVSAAVRPPIAMIRASAGPRPPGADDAGATSRCRSPGGQPGDALLRTGSRSCSLLRLSATSRRCSSGIVARLPEWAADVLRRGPARRSRRSSASRRAARFWFPTATRRAPSSSSVGDAPSRHASRSSIVLMRNPYAHRGAEHLPALVIVAPSTRCAVTSRTRQPEHSDGAVPLLGRQRVEQVGEIRTLAGHDVPDFHAPPRVGSRQRSDRSAASTVRQRFVWSTHDGRRRCVPSRRRPRRPDRARARPVVAARDARRCAGGAARARGGAPRSRAPPNFVARLTIELLRPVPLAPLDVHVRTIPPGPEGAVARGVAHRTPGDGDGGGTELVRATALRVRTDPALELRAPAPPPPELPRSGRQPPVRARPVRGRVGRSSRDRVRPRVRDARGARVRSARRSRRRCGSG